MSRVLWSLAVTAAVATASAAPLHPRWDEVSPAAEELIIRGALRSSLDGSVFDAVSQRGGYPGQPAADEEARPGGLFDLEAGGLRVAEQDPEAHLYRLVATGRPGAACLAAGLPSPCLVPRLRALAHERLVTTDELGGSLGGTLELESLPPPLLSAAQARTLAGVATLVAGLAAVGLAFAIRRRRLASGIGQVEAAAAEARRSLRGDASLAPLQTSVELLLGRAAELERARATCARRLARIDRPALEQRRALWASRAAHPDSAHALAMLEAEAEEANQLEADLAASAAGLERIASSLRALALHTRRHRGTRARAASDDPVDAMLGELELRDRAAAEAERLVVVRPRS
jgi:hypothetical protein